MAENEAVLLERFSRRADAEAFAELVRRYVRLVYSTAWRVLKDETEAADVTQETFFELTRHADRISGSLGVWLHRVATRKSIDLIRRSAHRRRREQVYAESRPEEVRTWHDLSGYVDEALDKLEEPTKALLLDHFLSGKTTSEIAREQGLSQATVSRRINDGLEQLRGTLRRQGLLVVAASLGTMLMDEAAQAVPAAVLTELSKMTLVGTTGTAAALGGKTALAAHAGVVKVVLATTALVAAASVIGYIQRARRPELPAQSPASTQTIPRSAVRSGGNRAAGARSTLVTRGAQSQNEVMPAASSSVEQPEMEEPILEALEPRPMGGAMAGISVGDPYDGVPTADLRTPEAAVYSYLALIDEGAADQVRECLAQGHEVATDGPYPRHLGRPIRLVEVKHQGDTAQVLWEATVHTAFVHKGRDCRPGEFVALSSRLVCADGLWKLLNLDE